MNKIVFNHNSALDKDIFLIGKKIFFFSLNVKGQVLIYFISGVNVIKSWCHKSWANEIQLIEFTLHVKKHGALIL